MIIYRKIPRKVIAIFYVVAVAVFLYLYLKGTDFSQLKTITINWWYIVIASFWALLFRYSMVYIWRVILRSLGTNKLPGFGIMAEVFAKAWISRYIPGTVTWIAGKIYMASQFGISKSRLAVSSLLEGGMQVVAAVVVSLLLIGFNPHINTIPLYVRILTVVISIISLFILLPPVFNRILHFAHVSIKKQPPSDELRINGSAVIKSFLWFVVGTFLNGTACYFLAIAVTGSGSTSLYFYIVGAFGLAGAIGMATPLLPSGLGVRDGVLLVLLGAVMPKDIALAITVLSRLWQVAVDGIFLGCTVAYSRITGEEIRT
ncbi:MAG TPA: lysylphosphatidylglycerol synthase domain-containing protein [Candidatus Saccharimonadales bacterium]|nr:lysylphosphatidylglycerol synthase domain-containing protein [Candidatus Saccharimonadales bacterium]